MCRNIRTLYNFDPPATEIEIRDDAYLVINRQRHGGQLTLLVPGVAGQDRIREGNGLLVRDSRASLGLWLSDGREVLVEGSP